MLQDLQSAVTVLSTRLIALNAHASKINHALPITLYKGVRKLLLSVLKPQMGQITRGGGGGGGKSLRHRSAELLYMGLIRLQVYCISPWT